MGLPGKDKTNEPARRFKWRRFYFCIAILLTLLFAWTVGMAFKRSAFDRPKLEELIAHGTRLEALVSNPRHIRGRGGNSQIDLQWASPFGVRCEDKDHQVSMEIFATFPRGPEMEVIVDPDDRGCRAVLADDLAFARRSLSPIPFLGAAALLSMAIAILAAQGMTPRPKSS